MRTRGATGRDGDVRGDIYHRTGDRRSASQWQRRPGQVSLTRGRKTPAATLQPMLLTALLFAGLAVLAVLSVRCAAEDAVHREAPQGSNADP